jgi:hypothetical protein
MTEIHTLQHFLMLQLINRLFLFLIFVDLGMSPSGLVKKRAHGGNNSETTYFVMRWHELQRAPLRRRTGTLYCMPAHKI